MFRLMISIIALLGATAGFSQQTITLAFTAIDSVAYVQLDSIKVMNRTKGGDTTLFWNDTVLVLNVPVGLPGINSRNSGFKVRGVPNPVTDKATIEVVLPWATRHAVCPPSLGAAQGNKKAPRPWSSGRGLHLPSYWRGPSSIRTLPSAPDCCLPVAHVGKQSPDRPMWLAGLARST